VGMTGFFTILTGAGLVQGHSWLNGETVYRVLPQLHVYMVARAASGILILAGAMVGLYNIVMSFKASTQTTSVQPPEGDRLP